MNVGRGSGGRLVVALDVEGDVLFVSAVLRRQDTPLLWADAERGWWGAGASDSKESRQEASTHVADNILDTVQSKRKRTVPAVQARNRDLRVVDDRVALGPRDSGRGELEGEVVKVLLVVAFVLVVFPLGSLLALAVVPGGGGDGGGGEEGDERGGEGKLHLAAVVRVCAGGGSGGGAVGIWGVEQGWSCWSAVLFGAGWGNEEEKSSEPWSVRLIYRIHGSMYTNV